MRRLSWLHLSDQHACTPKFSWDADQVTESLVEDLRRLQAEHGLRPDLLFFTGDAAFGEIGNQPEEKLRGQFERFADFLSAVRAAFEPEIALEDVFLVPGNHDVNREGGVIRTELQRRWTSPGPRSRRRYPRIRDRRQRGRHWTRRLPAPGSRQ